MFGANKMLQQMQQRANKLQEELAATTVEATAGGGAVTVVINGQMQLQSVKIDPEAVDPSDLTMLEDLIVAAVNEAVGKAQALVQQRTMELTKGMLPPGMRLPGLG